MVDYLKVYGGDLAPQLLPGERLTAMVAAGYVPGNEDIGPRDDRLAIGERVAAHVLGAPIYTRLTDRIVSGTSLVGFVGCLAIELRDALASMTTMLVLSDRRLLVAETPFELRAAPAVTWVAARGAVLDVVRAPRLAQRGRLLLTMADGSVLAVMTGVVRAGPAKRFVAAWHADRAS